MDQERKKNNQRMLRFYSRFSLSGSQPYLLTAEYEQGDFAKIPGAVWVPDFSMFQVNQPMAFYQEEESNRPWFRVKKNCRSKKSRI
jgi:hypothetical protein